jgi:hypothetical protein
MQICRRGVAPFARGVSTNKYHMLPPCGTNPAWRQGLLGRPAIAGCAPMLPRCGTSALLWSRGQWSVVSGPFTSINFVLFVTTFRVSEQPHWAPVSWRAWEANSRKHLKLRYLHLIATTCNYLQLIALVALVATTLFSHDLATLPFLAQTVPKSSTTHHLPPAPWLA